MQGGNGRHGELMERLRTGFEFRKWREIYEGSGGYLCRAVHHVEELGDEISMERYVKEKLKPIVLHRDKIKDEKRVLDDSDKTLVRGAGGSLL